jgi:phage gp29-like protein
MPLLSTFRARATSAVAAFVTAQAASSLLALEARVGLARPGDERRAARDIAEPMGWREKLATRLARGSLAATTKGGRVMPDLSLWASFQRIGGQLSPMDVSRIIRQADTGDMTALVDLANDARQKDCHLQSVLQTSEESISGLDWELELPDKATKKEQQAAAWVDAQLRACDDLARLFAHHAGARYYGHAVTEITWKRVGSKLAPSSFTFHSARRFGYREANGLLVWRDTGMSQDGVDFRADFPFRFIVSQPRVTGDVACREGLVRVLMWAALFRNWTLSDWLKLGEVAWKPWRIGYYKKDQSDPEDRAILEEAIEMMSSTGAAALPDSVKLELSNPQGTGGGGKSTTHVDLFDKMAAEMSKAVLGQTLTTDQGKVGSQALGNVHDDQKRSILEACARSIAADFTRDLVTRIYALNFPTTVRVARLRLVTQDAKDFASFAKGVKDLKDAGTRIPQAWVRDQAGIREPEANEECLGDGTPEGDNPDPKDPPPKPDDTPDSGDELKPEEGDTPEGDEADADADADKAARTPRKLAA